MARTISIVAQSFERLRANGYFYVDKTGFVRDWWQGGDSVTLVCRPRRFGKTLNLDTVRCFLSTEFAGRGEELFGGLDAWADPTMRALQGTVPVVAMSFAAVKATNHEVELTFDRMVRGWFAEDEDDMHDFARALLAGDACTATRCLAEVTLACMSSFDGANRPAASQPERFYHGLVLGLLASLRGRWFVESNRESGFGRYDVALVPTDGTAGTDPAVVMEFKVFDDWDEETLADTVARAHAQIDEKGYVAGLVERGIAPERIRTCGIAFRGKEVLVG
ncbi:MAG: AAA family ATPase [Atopobiaceae bacterium]|nr:AAA family ATPase [Atopobiaceae bacterium]